MNPQNGQSPLDYLNGIAPSVPQKKKFKFGLNIKTILIAFVVVLVVIITSASISKSITSAQLKPWQQFSAKLDATSVIVDDSSKKIKNSQLRSLNSDLRLYITNTKRDISPLLQKLNIDEKNLPAEITDAETNSGITERLEVGRLNAKYDSTYAREMTYQVAQLLMLLELIYKQNLSQSSAEILNTAYNNLAPTYTALSEFSASNE